MGNQPSHLGSEDIDVEADGNSVAGQSTPDRDRSNFLQSTKHDPENQGSPAPFFNPNSSQDFAFSSQVLQSASANRFVQPLRESIVTKFERPSSSPEPASIQPDPLRSYSPGFEAALPALDSASKSPKTKKRRRSKNKRSSLLSQDGPEDTMPPQNQEAETLPTYAPESSLGPTSTADLDEDDATTAPYVNGAAHASEADAEELRKIRKKERKERRRAKREAKADQLRSALLNSEPNFGDHQNSETQAEAQPAYLTTRDVKADHEEHEDQENHEDHEEPSEEPTYKAASAKKRKRSAQKNQTVTAPEVEDTVEEPHPTHDDVDAQSEDHHQLPTPDDEAHNAKDLHDASDAAAVASTTSPTVRKAQDSDKNPGKKRKHISESAGVEPDHESAEQDPAVADSPLRHRSTKKVRTKEPTAASTQSSRFGDFAQNLYSQRFGSQKTASSLPQSSQKRQSTEDSPSAARLERRAQDRATSPSAAHNIKHSPSAVHDNDDADAMDVDVAEGSGDEDRVDYDAQDEEAGSDDLGVGETHSTAEAEDEVAESDQDDLPKRAASGQIVVQDSQHAPSTAKSAKSKTLRQYGSKSSNGKKRLAKPSYLNREEEENAEALAELPSPTIAAASRKEKAKKPAAASSQTTLALGKPKLSSQMSGGTATTPSAVAEGKYRTKKARKVKDPSPMDETTGPFSQFELRNIDVAIQRWRTDHSMTQEEINDLVQKNPQKENSAEFWDHVQSAIPKRKRQKIINQCRRKYHNFVARGSWTQEQHEELVQVYAELGSKYRKIADRINRHPEDVRDRVRNYVVCGDKRKTDIWDKEEEERLIIIIEQALERIRVLKADPSNTAFSNTDQDDEELIDWDLVSQNMDRTRSRLQCRTKWKALRGAMEGGMIDGQAGRSMDDIIRDAREEVASMDSKDLYAIAKAIRDCGAKADSRIPWAKVKKASRSVSRWSRPALMIVWYRMRRTVPEWIAMRVPDLAGRLCSTYQETKEIPTLSEEDLNLRDEYREIEHKVSKIIGNNNKPKTPYLAIKSDEDGAEELEDEEDEADAEMDVAHDEAGPSASRIPARDSSLDLGLQESDAAQSADDNSGMPVRSKGKGKARTKLPTTSASKGQRKGKGKGRGKTTAESEDLDASSDTDADEATDIPARIALAP
ncbi:hypothetical protein BX600DRAFT_510797 [Xylariales sp. PMI_506]|nr:hypothetical protein BX600DRAFT_510797 [Xylariales sp. PMI_506]